MGVILKDQEGPKSDSKGDSNGRNLGELLEELFVWQYVCVWKRLLVWQYVCVWNLGKKVEGIHKYKYILPDKQPHICTTCDLNVHQMTFAVFGLFSSSWFSTRYLYVAFCQY